MYRDILSNEFLKISTLEDIRKIYDQLTTGEIAIEDSLDGQLFRSKFVSITNNNDKIEHIAPSTEPAITNMLNSWLTFINNRRFPFLIKASLAHYFFENVHPFYDGNGRTGRYILSKYLSRKLDKFSGLIINKKINENKTSYYKAFSDTGHYLNRADGTMFVHMILKYLIKGQNEIIAVLSDKKAGLSFYQDKIRHLKLTLPQSEVLYLILQSQLFTDNELEVLTQSELLEILKHTEYSQRSIKQALKDLEEADFIYRIYNNPIKYLISKSFFNHS
ncbi:Fic family protein [Streptococcus fryi]